MQWVAISERLDVKCMNILSVVKFGVNDGDAFKTLSG